MELNVSVRSVTQLLLSMLSMLVCTPQINAAEDNAPTLGISAAHWPPYIYHQNDVLTGEDYEVLKQVLAHMHYDLQSYPLPERRVGEQIARGGIDIVVGAARNEDRQRNNLFSIPYRAEFIGFAYLPERASEFAGKTLFQLLSEGHTLALNTSGWYGSEFEEKIASRFPKQLIHLESVKRRLAFLKRERVDLILDDTAVLQFTADSNDIALTLGNEIIQKQNVHFMFSKYSVSPEFVSQFNEVLQNYLNERPGLAAVASEVAIGEQKPSLFENMRRDETVHSQQQ